MCLCEDFTDSPEFLDEGLDGLWQLFGFHGCMVAHWLAANSTYWILFLFANHIYSLKPTSTDDSFAAWHDSGATLEMSGGQAVPRTPAVCMAPVLVLCWPSWNVIIDSRKQGRGSPGNSTWAGLTCT